MPEFPTLMLTVGIDRESGQMAATSTIEAARQLEDTRLLIGGLESLLSSLRRQEARLEVVEESRKAPANGDQG